jgi:hypothetical protein
LIGRIFKDFLPISQPKVETENGLNEKALATLFRRHDELRVHLALSVPGAFPFRRIGAPMQS